ncbi:hypothetical protein LSTR_LSTR003101 [Laodelphax striatellus]|uniref:Uncharacterized protein n=1 Tax=Laodelphax striatellus TaxID=195883 RepID=A0A482WXA2_LAOST|nr:hypothetical protein LSTR_LSTR003101 [Laodelphax striatellus]
MQFVVVKQLSAHPTDSNLPTNVPPHRTTKPSLHSVIFSRALLYQLLPPILATCFPTLWRQNFHLLFQLRNTLRLHVVVKMYTLLHIIITGILPNIFEALVVILPLQPLLPFTFPARIYEFPPEFEHLRAFFVPCVIRWVRPSSVLPVGCPVVEWHQPPPWIPILYVSHSSKQRQRSKDDGDVDYCKRRGVEPSFYIYILYYYSSGAGTKAEGSGSEASSSASPITELIITLIWPFYMEEEARSRGADRDRYRIFPSEEARANDYIDIISCFNRCIHL